LKEHHGRKSGKKPLDQVNKLIIFDIQTNEHSCLSIYQRNSVSLGDKTFLMLINKSLLNGASKDQPTPFCSELQYRMT